MDTITRLAGVIADCTKVHPAAITPGMRLGGISTDEHEWFSILPAIERAFHIEVREREFDMLITVADLIELIEAKRSAQEEQAA